MMLSRARTEACRGVHGPAKMVRLMSHEPTGDGPRAEPAGPARRPQRSARAPRRPARARQSRTARDGKRKRDGATLEL